MKNLSVLCAFLLGGTVLSGLASQAVAQVDATSTLIGATSSIKQIHLVLSLRSPKEADADAFVKHVTTLGDPLYHRYLSPAQYASRFGPSEENYDAVALWAKAHGLTVGEKFAARTIMPISGSATAIEAALGVKFNDYRGADGRSFYASEEPAALPSAIDGKVEGVIGLSSAIRFAPQHIKLPASRVALSGRGPGGGFSASDLRTAYEVPAQPFAAHTETLAVFEQGGYDATDIQTYLSKNDLPMVPVSPRSVNGFGSGINDPGIELEAVLDIDMEVAINPVAKQVIVYEDGADPFQVALVDSLAAMASDDTANSIGISYGLDEARQGRSAIKAENKVLTELAAQGQAVFASAGDNGAYGTGEHRLNVLDPGAQPLVTSVGGTTLFTGPKEVYQAEIVWNELLTGLGATGGGVSHVWDLPFYQTQHGGSVSQGNGGSVTHRNVPDVASVGDSLTGVAVYSKLNGGWVVVGGTSVSAPIWAGFYSLVDAVSQGLGYGSAGFADPAIYQIGSGYQRFFPEFNDVFDGSNGNKNEFGYPGFNAGYEYDNTTGWGSFNGSNLLGELALLPSDSGANPPPAVRGLAATAASTTATLSWTGAPADIAFLAVIVDYQTGRIVTTDITKTPLAKVSGLNPSTTYVFQVYAIAKGGNALSGSDFFTTTKAAN